MGADELMSIIKFITNYIKGRKAYTTYRNHTSRHPQFKTGVPHGGVLSSTLFNIYTADILPPRAWSWHTQMTSPSHLYTQARMQPRNTYNNTYIKFFPGQNNLTLNRDKTTCTLFTPDPAEYESNLDLKINNIALPMTTHPMVQGLTLDPKLLYSTHIQYTQSPL